MTQTSEKRSIDLGLNGEKVLVTGGGTGIGRATALRFAMLGADVAILGRRRPPLEGVVAEIAEMGVGAMCTTADIRDEDQVRDAFRQFDDTWGGVDILVNNAGGQFPQLAIDMSVKGWRSVVDLNLNGTFIVSQTFAQSVIARRSTGRIVNVTTAAAIRPSTGLAHTISARAGVIAMTRTLALEWAEHGITVNGVAPGMINTSGLVDAELEGDSAVIDQLASAAIPLGRVGTPEELGEVIAFLASRSCSYMTGETVLLDGGYSLGPGMHVDQNGHYA